MFVADFGLEEVQEGSGDAANGGVRAQIGTGPEVGGGFDHEAPAWAAEGGCQHGTTVCGRCLRPAGAGCV